jgi:hypothetical protein
VQREETLETQRTRAPWSARRLAGEATSPVHRIVAGPEPWRQPLPALWARAAQIAVSRGVQPKCTAARAGRAKAIDQLPRTGGREAPQAHPAERAKAARPAAATGERQRGGAQCLIEPTPVLAQPYMQKR